MRFWGSPVFIKGLVADSSPLKRSEVGIHLTSTLV